MEKCKCANEDTGLLGLIAILCMICDHLGAAFFADAMWLRVIGRIAFPLYAWGVAVGAEHTRSWRRYAARLLALGVISQPFYMFALNHPITKFNVLATLLLGLIAICGIREKKYWLSALAVLLPCFIEMDYGVRGVMLVLLLWACQDNPLALGALFSAYCVFWGANSRQVFLIGPYAVRLQQLAILALPLMLWPRRARTKIPRAVAYGAYPAHLALIWLAKELL